MEKFGKRMYARAEEYDVEEKQAKKDTAAVVGKFREAGILDE